MADSLKTLDERVDAYVAQNNLTLARSLGHGNDGGVYLTTAGTAVKAFYGIETYERERNCYVRIFERRTKSVAGFEIPELINYANRLMIIEMGVVSPPCVLDFGKAYVDRTPDYSPEVLAETEAAERELFEPQQWKDVLRVRGSEDDWHLLLRRAADEHYVSAAEFLAATSSPCCV